MPQRLVARPRRKLCPTLPPLTEHGQDFTASEIGEIEWLVHLLSGKKPRPTSVAALVGIEHFSQR
jgi:hypothetical protein